MTVQSSQPLITVAICTRNRATLLAKTMRSVLSQLTDDVEVLIVDNDSTDNTPELIRQFAASCPQLKTCKETRIGGTVARNTAISKANGRFVLFMDDDSVPDAGWLEAYRRFFMSASSRIAVVAGAHFPEYEFPPPRWMKPKKNRLDFGPSPFCLAYGSSPAECNCAYLRSAVVEAGLFDERLGHTENRQGFGEGADLNLRLQNAGYEIWWLPGAVVRDFFPASRMNLKYILRSAFNYGRSGAIRHLKSRPDLFSNFVFRCTRLLIFPFQCGINLLGAMFLWPFKHGQLAVRFLERAVQVTGIAYEVLWFRAGAEGVRPKTS
ncbi:MAG TPA: glycosyltransferase [Verrucomicrobiae bacterium]|nr:glycosyltransferase [Verrucomicrobiae bacterium]